MNPFHEISDEIDRFYERNMRAPDFVLVGLREWTRMAQLADLTPDEKVALSFNAANELVFSVYAFSGKIPVKCHPTYYSMIAPVLERRP